MGGEQRGEGQLMGLARLHGPAPFALCWLEDGLETGEETGCWTPSEGISQKCSPPDLSCQNAFQRGLV